MHILKKDMKIQNLLLQAQNRTLINTTFKSGSQSYKFSFASVKDVFKPYNERCVSYHVYF